MATDGDRDYFPCDAVEGLIAHSEGLEYKLRIDVKLLNKLMEALGIGDRIEMRFSKKEFEEAAADKEKDSYLGIIRISNYSKDDGAFGLMMPLRWR